MSKFKKSFIFILIILIIFPATVFSASTDSVQTYQNEPDLLFFIDVFNYINTRYPFDIENKDLMEGALKGMLQTLDPYSDYYTKEEASELYESLLGNFSGIGIYIEEKDSYINIIDTINDSPAEKEGLKKGDLIVSIDDKDTKGLSTNEAKHLIQGLIGTTVKLGIKREQSKDIIYKEIIRDNIIINPVKYEILDNKIGYIKLSDFSNTAATEIKKALDEFDKKKIIKVILDLRNNPGGLLNQAIEVSKPFVPSGPIVHIKEKDTELLTHISTTTKPKYKLVLLVNERSASASEILAGAIKDTKAGTIIGKKTFGKGIVQSMLPLANGGIIKITTAEYLTPNKTSIHGIGVEPDIVVENIDDVDEQLKAAIKALNKKN